MVNIVSIFLAVFVLTTMGALGTAILRRTIAHLSLLEYGVYGFPLGVVGVSLVLVPIASLVQLRAALIVSCMVACVVAAGVLGVMPRPSKVFRLNELRQFFATFTPSFTRARLASNVPVIMLALLVIRLAVFWAGALVYDAGGLWAGHINIWGDWTQHIGDVYSFVYGMNLPPDHPRFAGHAYPYHYLASFTAALMVPLGMQPTTALTMHSFIFCVMIVLGLYAFTLRLTGHRGTATLALFIFMFGGGLGWTLPLAEWWRTAGTETPWRVWEQGAQEAANFRWQNMYFALIMPQRGYLYGLPLALLVLTLLHIGVRTYERRVFIVAGVVAGLLPLAHLSTLLALALITPFLVVLFPSRRWVAFFVVWIILAVPQLYAQQGGERGALAALRWQVGWVSAPDGWLWFWVKNLGWFVPLLVFALSQHRRQEPVSGRFLLAFMPVFVLANLIVFQPWDWDNIKVLLYWFLASSILVGVVLTQLWNARRLLARGFAVIVVTTMVLSGVLLHIDQLVGNDRHLLLSGEELELGAAIRAQTPPDAIFVAGLHHNHPVSVVSGRRVVIGYPGPLWATGLDYESREQDVRAIYQFAANTPQLLAKYNVSYVVVGPRERDQLKANSAAFRTHYRHILHTAHYDVYKIE
jgi:hypothetical protein